MTYTSTASGTFTVAGWEETTEADIDGTGTTRGETYAPDRGITRASVRYAYSGDIEGSSTVSYVFAYAGEGAPILGLEHFTGSIGGHDGSCVFRHTGSHGATSVTAHLEVVPGMGTGGLEGLRGEAELTIAGEAPDGYPFSLSYDLG
jgi:hypothetical protein